MVHLFPRIIAPADGAATDQVAQTKKDLSVTARSSYNLGVPYAPSSAHP